MDATGVVIAGYNVNEKKWKDVAWGNPPHQLGRVPKGIEVALREHAGLIIFGGGGSHYEISGEVEAEHTIAYLLNNWDSLYAFSAFQGCRRALDLLRRRLESGAAIPETRSGNTEQEVRHALEICVEYRVARAIVISSADHICRCYLHALRWVSENTPPSESPCLRVSAEAGEACYSRSGVKGVVVQEQQGFEDSWEAARDHSFS